MIQVLSIFFMLKENILKNYKKILTICGALNFNNFNFYHFNVISNNFYSILQASDTFQGIEPYINYIYIILKIVAFKMYFSIILLEVWIYDLSLLKLSINYLSQFVFINI